MPHLYEPVTERRHRGRMGEQPKSGSRRFQDSAGSWWRVYEQSAEQNTASPGRSCLIFECDLIARRVLDYPRDWATLSDEALEGLSQRR